MKAHATGTPQGVCDNQPESRKSLPRRPIITQEQRECPQHAPGEMATEQRLPA